MSKYGLKIAKFFGESLPSFHSKEEATRHFYAIRDNALAELTQLSKSSGNKFLPDFSPKSLANLETWYFELYESGSFDTLPIERQTFESHMGLYFLAVISKNNAGAQWIVSEFPFEKGKFELGVKKGLLTKMLSPCRDYYRTPNNQNGKVSIANIKKNSADQLPIIQKENVCFNPIGTT